MKLTKKLLPVAMSVAIAAPLLVGAPAAHAGLSATLGAANMYLWRGVNLTPDAPQIHGSLDYAFDSGVYAGVWTSNEDAGTETDLYLGYGTSFGELGFDISYWKYIYPENDGTGSLRRGDTGFTGASLGDTDTSEVIVTGSFGPVSASAYVCVESGCDDNYYTLSGDIGKFNLTYGVWDFDAANANNYSHLTLTYGYNDNLSFGVNVAKNDSGFSDDGLNPTGVEEDPLFLVSYTKTFDM